VPASSWRRATPLSPWSKQEALETIQITGILSDKVYIFDEATDTWKREK